MRFKIEACQKMYLRIVLQTWSTLSNKQWGLDGLISTSVSKLKRDKKMHLKIVIQNWSTLWNKQLGLDGLISKNLFQNWSPLKNVLEDCTSNLKYTLRAKNLEGCTSKLNYAIIQTIMSRLVDLKESVSKLKRAKKCTWELYFKTEVHFQTNN